MGDPDKRYFTVSRGKDANGHYVTALIEGIPNPQKPGKYLHTGPTVLEGTQDVIWSALKKAGFVWTESNFHRYWAFSPARAAKVQNL